MISITDGLQALYNSNMREKTPLELERENRMLKQQIDQLTNNWNELEEWAKEKRDYYDKNDEYSNFRVYADELDDVLDKMNEIKENNE